jgi:hypothetical protein
MERSVLKATLMRCRGMILAGSPSVPNAFFYSPRYPSIKRIEKAIEQPMTRFAGKTSWLRLHFDLESSGAGCFRLR